MRCLKEKDKKRLMKLKKDQLIQIIDNIIFVSFQALAINKVLYELDKITEKK